jgi:integrase
VLVNGPHELAKKIERKKMSARDENRHLEIRKEVYFPMKKLVDRYEEEYARKKKSYDRERSVLNGIRKELGSQFVGEIDGTAIQRWYRRLVDVQGLSPGTAVRHFNVMHHMMGRAATIWSKETGIDRNPADQIEIQRVDDQRDRYLNQEEICRLRKAMDQRVFRDGLGGGSSSQKAAWAFYRLRLVVLTAVTTGMRIAEIFAMQWSDLDYPHGVIAVRSRLKQGKVRYVPMAPELAEQFRRYPAVIGEDRIFPPKPGAKRGRQRVERSFETVLIQAGIANFRFHDLRHTFASWYMMNGGDLYELAKILGHSNIKMTERYAKLSKQHITKTGSTAREMWRLMEEQTAGTGTEEAI